MKVTRRPATGEESVEFVHRNIPFGLQCETAEETSEDRRDTDRDEVGDIDVDRLLLGMPGEKEDPIQYELESRAVMAGWEKHYWGKVPSAIETNLNNEPTPTI